MSKKRSKHIKQSSKHYNKSYTYIAFVIVLILAIILIVNMQKNIIKETENKNTQIILNNENITANLQEQIIIENDKIYLSYNDIQNFFDKTIYQEEDTGIVVTGSSKKIASIKKDEENITINGSKQTGKDILIEKDNKKYIAISELQNVYDYEFKYIENSNIVTIDNLNKKMVKVNAKKNIKIKKENKMNSQIIEKVEKGNELILIEEEKGIAKVRTPNGNIGYINTKNLENFVTEREDFNEKQNIEMIDKECLEYDITKKDISSYEKRLNIANSILQEAIKNGKMQIKVIYKGTDNFNIERFNIEVTPMLRECGMRMFIE